MPCDFLTDFTLAKLIDPIPADTFLAEYWERKPLLIQRGDRGYYGDLLTLADFDSVIANNPNSLKVANNTDETKKYARGNVNESPEAALAEMREGSTLTEPADRTGRGSFCRGFGGRPPAVRWRTSSGAFSSRDFTRSAGARLALIGPPRRRCRGRPRATRTSPSLSPAASTGDAAAIIR